MSTAAAARELHRHAVAPAALLLAGAVLLLSALPVRPGHVGLAEEVVFRAVNGVSWVATPPVWVVMQLGSLLAIPVVAVGAALVRRYRLAARLAASGALAYLLAPPIKAAMERGRPAVLLDHVVLRDMSDGFGFVSGHAAVAVALAVTALPFLGWRGRAVVLALAGAVAVARVYVGVHLPLDVIGGAALGVLLAAAVHLGAERLQAGLPGTLRRRHSR